MSGHGAFLLFFPVSPQRVADDGLDEHLVVDTRRAGFQGK